MLYVYVSSHCRGCATAQQLITQLRTMRPQVPVTVVDLSGGGDTIPDNVIGTPMYLWNGRVLFMGNPDVTELLQRVDECVRTA